MRRLQLLLSTAILILGGLLIVAVTTVVLYKTYTDHKLQMEALQMAKTENRMVEISTQNGYNFCLNVDRNSMLSMAGQSTSVTTVAVYPRDYKKECVEKPNGEIITPYSVQLSEY